MITVLVDVFSRPVEATMGAFQAIANVRCARVDSEVKTAVSVSYLVGRCTFLRFGGPI